MVLRRGGRRPPPTEDDAPSEEQQQHEPAMIERARPPPPPPPAPRGTTARAAAAVARWTRLPPDAARLLLMAALVRVALICWGEVQDRLSPDVKYTDTDYGVFTDAARSIWRGDGGAASASEAPASSRGLMRGTPFARATYRYSPLLAYAVLPNLVVGVFGKVLFSAADLVAGVQCYRLAEAAMGGAAALTTGGGATGAAPSPSPSSPLPPSSRALVLSAAAGWWAAAAWLFNPFTATVSTRGSCDSLAVVMLLGLLQLLLALGPPPAPPPRGRGGGGGGGAAPAPATAPAAAFFADVLRDLPGSFRAVAPAAALYGLAVHFRIYPIIYAPSTVLFLARRRARAAEEEEEDKAGEAAAAAAAGAAGGGNDATPQQQQRRGGCGGKSAAPQPLPKAPPRPGGGPPFFLSRPFLRGLLTDGAAFGVVSAGAFVALGLAFYFLYGREFLHEAFLHHLGRLDPRHNFSAYFYPIYLRHFGGLGEGGGLALSAGGGGAAAGVWGAAAVDPARWAGLPQVAVLLAVAFDLHAHLPLAWLLSTVAFVALNKVSTAQYFVWYFCLLPPALPHLLRWGDDEDEGGGGGGGDDEGREGQRGVGAFGGGLGEAGGRGRGATGGLSGGGHGGSSSSKRKGAAAALAPPRPSVPRPLLLAAAAWALLQLHWLAWGYAVEFAGRGAFLGLWAASVAFLAANAGLAAALVLCYRPPPRASFLARSLFARRRRRQGR